MQFNVSFPVEIEQAIRRCAAAAGQDVESFVKRVLTEEVEETVPDERRRPHSEFVAGLRAMIDSHGISNGRFDDSRESIYEGRGE